MDERPKSQLDEFVWSKSCLISLGGGICYAAFIAQLIYPNDILLYGCSALIGLGAALIWVAQVSLQFQNVTYFIWHHGLY